MPPVCTASCSYSWLKSAEPRSTSTRCIALYCTSTALPVVAMSLTATGCPKAVWSVMVVTRDWHWHWRRLQILPRRGKTLSTQKHGTSMPPKASILHRGSFTVIPAAGSENSGAGSPWAWSGKNALSSIARSWMVAAGWSNSLEPTKAISVGSAAGMSSMKTQPLRAEVGGVAFLSSIHFLESSCVCLAHRSRSFQNPISCPSDPGERQQMMYSILSHQVSMRPGNTRILPGRGWRPMPHCQSLPV